MESTDLLVLQNGSDIRGIAISGINGEEVNLTAEIVEKIAISYVHWLGAKTNKSNKSLKISVGRDSRVSGPKLMDAFIRGIRASAAMAIDCGIASTPAMYMSLVFEDTKFDGAAMITASHLPYNRNGIKLFSPSGGLEKQDITNLLNNAATINTFISDPSGKIEKLDLLTKYSQFLVKTIRKGVNHPVNFEKPLSGLRIIVDAGNGAGGFFADKVLNELGADTTGSQFLEPDGMFPNHIPNPEDESAMEFIQKAVVTNNADLGIIFDTDVDRAAAVDKNGSCINRNNLIALIAAIILEDKPGSTIVTDSITSEGLTDFIENELRGKHHRFKRGYKNVINEAIRLNKEGHDCWIAIETSGHAALKDNYFLDDGAYLITKILIKAAKLKIDGSKTIADIIKNMRTPKESKEFRFKIKNIDFRHYGNLIIADLEKFVGNISGWKIVPNNYEGIRVSCDKNSGFGWFLLRLSLHDPVIPLNVESEIEGGVKQIVTILSEFLANYEDLDCNAIDSYLK